MLFVIVIFIILFPKPSDQIVNRKGPTIVKEFVSCISALIDNNFQEPGLLVFGNSPNSSPFVMTLREEVLKNIHKTHKFVVQIAVPHYKAICVISSRNKSKVLNLVLGYKSEKVANYFVIIADGAEDFFYIASRIVTSPYWNPYAKFIVVLCHLKISTRRATEEIFSCLFNYNAVKVIVCTFKDEMMRSMYIFGWRPYDPPTYCGYGNETSKNRLIIENICDRGIVKHMKTVFDDRIPKNMHGCSIYMLALERQPFLSRIKDDPNIEKVLANELLYKFNFSVKYEIVNAFRGERDKKGNWNGALKELVAGRGHLLLGGIFPDFDVHEDFESSLTYLSDSYAWIVPRAYPSPPWIALTISFHEYVWCFSIIGFIFCVFVWKILGHLSCDTKYNKTFMHCLLNVWILSLGFCTYMRPVEKSLRIFYIFLNIYCMLLITAYQTKLIEVLWNPTYEYQIHTVEELISSQIKFGGSEELHDLFYNSSDPFDNLIGEKWIDVRNISKALLDVAVYRNFSVLCSRLELAYLSATIPQLTDNFGNDNYYAFKMNTFTVPIEMIALKGFPFMTNISRTLGIYKQLGLNSMLKQYFTTLNMKKRGKVISRHGHHNSLNALSVQHLQGGFLALALGMVGGTVILIIELIFDCNYR